MEKIFDNVNNLDNIISKIWNFTQIHIFKLIKKFIYDNNKYEYKYEYNYNNK